MTFTDHPIIRDTQRAMLDAIIYHQDPLASVVASRLVVIAATGISENRLREAYGHEWESVLGILRLAETVTEDEERIMSDRLTLRHRRLITIGLTWLGELGRSDIARDVFEDLVKLSRVDVAERTLTALRAAAVAGLLHRDTAQATPITTRDEAELGQPIRAVLISRGVNL